MYLSEATELLQAVLHANTDKSLFFTGLCTDTRQIKAGDLFVALKGDHFDGHNFIAKAQELGAVAALVERPLEGIKFPQLEVKDTVLALGKLGVWKRKHHPLPVLVVTGSCGKTTTKEILANILLQNNNTLSSIKSFNNHLGVPLTLWQLNFAHEFAVLEIGANHLGEIAYLTDLIQPEVAIIINAAPVHLEGFGDMDGVARAKGEIFQGLKQNGVAILNADDKYCAYWRDLVKDKKIITFGLHNNADIRATNIRFADNGSSSFILGTPCGEVEIALQLLGQHNVINALAAAAGAFAVKISLRQIKAGLENAMPVEQRLVTHQGYAGAKIIDDSYNANPCAVEAVLEMLEKQSGEKILVLGDMLELGKEAAFWHEMVGKIAHEKGVYALYAYGPSAALAAHAFGDRGYGFADKKELIVALKKKLNPSSVVLVKGSFGMGMDEVVKALIRFCL